MQLLSTSCPIRTIKNIITVIIIQAATLIIVINITVDLKKWQNAIILGHCTVVCFMTVLCFMYCVLCIVFYVLCFMYCVLCIVFYVLCFMYCVFSMGHCALPEIKLSYLILYYMELDIRMFTVVLTLLRRVLDIYCQIDSSQCLAQLTPARVGKARSVHVQLGACITTCHKMRHSLSLPTVTYICMGELPHFHHSPTTSFLHSQPIQAPPSGPGLVCAAGQMFIWDDPSVTPLS